MNSDPFWYDDYNILWKSQRLNEFFPSEDQTLEERLNAIVRFSFYVSVILYFYHNEPKYFGFFIGGCLLTIFVYNNNSNGRSESIENVNVDDEVILQKECKNKTQPTLDNPFMNYTIKDAMNIDENEQKTRDKEPICDTNNVVVKKEIEKMFNNNLYKDVNDVFGRMNSQRQFYTMPWTGPLPDEKHEFRDWLYKTDKTCKENDNCLRYEDLRAKAPVFPNPESNPLKTL
jgi:hypothetical protein